MKLSESKAKLKPYINAYGEQKRAEKREILLPIKRFAIALKEYIEMEEKNKPKGQVISVLDKAKMEKDLLRANKLRYKKEKEAEHSKNIGKIYFIEAKEINRIKIGFSANPEDRLKSLQISSPVELTLLITIKGTQTNEQQLHRRFSKDRVHREWFEASKELMYYINDVMEIKNIIIRHKNKIFNIKNEIKNLKTRLELL